MNSMNAMNMDILYRTAIAAAFRSGTILRHYFRQPLTIRNKGAIDLVTEADVESEKAIVDTIRSRFPDHDVIAEEGGGSGGGNACRWIVDPLDGTTNFVHGIDLFSISIAFSVDGVLTIGVVLNPVRGELFGAVRGEGATLNGEAIQVSETGSLTESLLVTGFPYEYGDHFEAVMARFSRAVSAARGVRRLGSAALDLCYLACGRFEGYWEQFLKPWDTAAGVVIAREAGARVTDFGDRPYTVASSELLATNRKIHSSMLSLLTTAERE